MTLSPGAPTTDNQSMTMQEAFAELVRAHVAPALKAAGFRKKGRATWYDRRPGGGWVILALRNDKWNSAQEVQFWAEGSCWPPGTWQIRQTVLDRDPDAGDPNLDPTAPLAPDSRVATRVMPAHEAWTLRDGVDPADVAAEVVAWLLATGDDLRSVADDVEVLVDRLVGDHDGVWQHTYAVAAMKTVADDHPRLAEAVERITRTWVVDPRPIGLRRHLERWREEAGLEPVDLPTFWSPSMMPTWRDRFPTPQDAVRAGVGTTFHHADGSTSDEPPPGWLGAVPAPAPRRRSWWSRRKGPEETGHSRHGRDPEP